MVDGVCSVVAVRPKDTPQLSEEAACLCMVMRVSAPGAVIGLVRAPGVIEDPAVPAAAPASWWAGVPGPAWSA